MHSSHLEEFRASRLWLLFLLASLILILVLPAPDAARGLASYAPLHTAIEVFAICVAAMVFTISWTAQKYRPNGRTLIVGVAFLGVALLDLTHTLSYQGMPDLITPSDPEKAINFWIAARSLAAIALLGVALRPRTWDTWTTRGARFQALGAVLLLVAGTHYLLLWHPYWMPRTFVHGVGLTAFKVGTEYALILIYLAAGIGFLRHLDRIRHFGASRMALACFTMALSEYLFTLYANVTDVYNLAGHVYKIMAYGFLYRELFVETVQEPYEDLQTAEARQRATLNTLPDVLFEVDRNGVFLAVHAHQAGPLAVPARALLGRQIRDALSKDAARTWMQALREADRAGSTHGHRFAAWLPDGEHHFELAVARKPGSVGEDDTYLGLSRDITETVRNERRIAFEARLNAALLELQDDMAAGEATLLRRGLEHAERLTQSHLAVLHLVREDTEGIELLHWSADGHGMTQAIMPDALRTRIASPVWARALRERAAVHLDDAAPTAPGGEPDAALGGMHRLVSIPVVESGKVCLLLGVADKPHPYDAQDIQALQVLADALWSHLRQQRQEAVIRRISKALDQSPHPVVITDVGASIVYVNQAFSTVSGYAREEVLGRNPRLLQSGATPASTYQALWSRLTRGQPWQGEFVNRRRNGEVYVETASLYPIRDAAGRLTHYVAHKEDITERRKAEERLRALSDFDPLTGLFNRKAFEEQLAQALDGAATRGEQLALLWIDLDNFRAINESLGHATGDELLVETANRVRGCLGNQVALARYAGDDFVAILPGADQAKVALLARDVLSALQAPLSLHERRLAVGASIGVAVYPGDAQSPGALASAAEVAMYRVKQEGRNGLRFFAPEMQAHTERSLELAAGLAEAVDKGELFLVYQPQQSLQDRTMIGVEALLRWRHPVHGLISPGEFIPIAEQTGHIVRIGRWVVEEAARQLRLWDEAGLPPLPVAVNVSAVQFTRTALVEELLAAVGQAGIAPSRIEVELTEAVALSSPERAAATMERLHQAGFKVALDDFGTGYSSMNYLKRYAIDKLKIDQSFVRELAEDHSDRAIVRAVVQMAHSLGMRTLAEGVETPEQVARLQACGCDAIQGYWYSRPLEANALAAFVRAQTAENIDTA